MPDPNPTRDRSNSTRKERRYKTSEEHVLRCHTSCDDVSDENWGVATGKKIAARASTQDSISHGTVVDLSTSGIRLLSQGAFKAGQKIRTELLTDRSHGIYRGVVRRVEPWVGGQSILGCSLEDPIADSVLQDLANEGVVNRRADGRIRLSQAAKIRWQLNAEETEVQIRDYSKGGMKIESPVDLPEGVSLRIEIESESFEPLSVHASLVWKHAREQGCVAGVAFTNRDAPLQVANALGISDDGSLTSKSKSGARSWLRRATMAAMAFGTIVGGLLLSGIELPWALILR